MNRASQIRQRLEHAFEIETLEVRDDSEAHRGHAGFQEGGESHFHLVLTTPDFAGLSRVARHRAVHTAIGPDLMGQIHALSMDLSEC